MKIQKGDAGYLRKRKKILIIETILSFGIVAGLLILGYLTTDTKLNLLTVVAVLGCLPACRILVNLIMLLPHHSLNEAKEMEIDGGTGHLTVVYDLVITSEKKAMPIEAIAIYGNTVCGYSSSPKVDTNYAAKHIKSILAQNKLEKVNVKIFHDYVAFLSRAEGMDSIAAIEQEDTKRREKKIRSVILDISL